jgi:5-methylcytosine-specific restriction endonuclease McrA
LNSQRIKRQYVWAKTGGRCWYCGARLYRREQADTELKKRLVFTADHLHPRFHGGRGRANKVPACKYCNSHKSSRSVEQFRLWVHARQLEEARRGTAPAGEQLLKRWKITAETVIFYFELTQLPGGGAG